MAYSVFVVYTVQSKAFGSPHKQWCVYTLLHSFSIPGKSCNALTQVVMPFAVILQTGAAINRFGSLQTELQIHE